jgi:general secretion pathway protein B
LAPDLRAAVPAMAFGGHVHSPAPASRMLIVNGQVLREGDTVTPELRLETIGRKSAVFSIRGQRFQVPL